MKTYVSVTIAIAAAAVVFAAGYQIGQNQANQVMTDASAKFALDGLASSLFMLEKLDEVQNKEVTRIVQATTSGQLATVVNSNLYKNEQTRKYACFILRRTNDYRRKVKLFETSEWDNMRKQDDFNQAEIRNKLFLEQELDKYCLGK